MNRKRSIEANLEKLPPFGGLTIDIDTLGSDLTRMKEPVKSIELRKLSYVKFLPRILELMTELKILGTFFVIGVDTKCSQSRKVLKRISDEGHELANHTMNHRKQFVNLPLKQQRDEILDCQRRLEDLSGKPVVGFRAPGFTVSKQILLILRELNYEYDSSLNASRLFLIIKKIIKKCFLKGESKSYLTVQDLNGLSPKFNLYFPDRENLFKTAPGNQNSIIEIPINIVPFFDYPFISATLLKMGYLPSRFFYSLILRKYKFLNFVLHDVEFAVEDDFTDAYVYENSAEFGTLFYNHYSDIKIEKRLVYFRKLFRLFVRDFSMITMKELASRFREKKILEIEP